MKKNKNLNCKMKIIFLDIDGVLNGYNKWTDIFGRLFSKIGLLEFFLKKYDINGLHERKIRVLSKIVKKTGAKIVLSSSTRHSFFNSFDKKSERNRILYKKSIQYNFDIIDITPNLHQVGKYSRAVEISAWLEKHKEQVESFVILDDENFDLVETFGNRVVITSKDGNIRGAWEEDPGLKRKHIKHVVKILNEKG